MNNSLSLGVTPRSGRGRGAKELPQLQNGVGRFSDEIEILHTDTLLKEVCFLRFWANLI